ncbi:Uncharacterised protein [Bordetella pertussis]|nr:Uncharacterised protein [Bordetella pertussis]
MTVRAGASGRAASDCRKGSRRLRAGGRAGSLAYGLEPAIPGLEIPVAVGGVLSMQRRGRSCRRRVRAELHDAAQRVGVGAGQCPARRGRQGQGVHGRRAGQPGSDQQFVRRQLRTRGIRSGPLELSPAAGVMDQGVRMSGGRDGKQQVRQQCALAGRR